MILRRLASFLGLSSVFASEISMRSDAAMRFQVHQLKKFADRFRADHGRERVLAIFVLRAHIFVFRQQLTLFERRQARVEDDIGLEVEDALKILERHVEQQADARGQRLQKPDVGDGRGERDVAHAVTPHAREGDLDAALLANDALVFHPLIFAAQALIVLDRTEDARAEQSVALWLERAVVDRLGLFDLAVRPGKDLLRACDRNLNLVEGLRRHDRIEEIHDLLLIHGLLLGRCECGFEPYSARREILIQAVTARSETAKQSGIASLRSQ